MKSFYVLPAFSDGYQWYDALDKSHFIPAHMIYALLSSRSSSIIKESERIFSAVPQRPYDPFGKDFGSALKADKPTTEKDIIQSISQMTDENTWAYLIGG